VKKSKKGESFRRFGTLGTVGLLVIAAVGPQFGISIPILSDLFSDSSSLEAKLTLDGTENDVTVTVNGTKMAKALPASLKGLPVGIPLQIVVTRPDGAQFQDEIILRKGEQRKVAVILSTNPAALPTTLEAAPTAQNTVSPSVARPKTSEKTIQLRLNLIPGVTQAKIILNNSPIDSNYAAAQVPLDIPLVLQVESPGYKPYRKDFTLASKELNGLREWPIEVALEPAHFGTLTIHTVPSADAILQVGGAQWRKKTPVENEKIAVGTYSLQLINDILGMGKTLNITIEEGKQLMVDERLTVKN
jgi:hypothetical protein